MKKIVVLCLIAFVGIWYVQTPVQADENVDARKAQADKINALMEVRQKVIHIGGGTAEDIGKQLASDLPEISTNPEQFVPCYVHACILIEEHEGRRIPLSNTPVHYSCDIPTAQGIVRLQGTIYTDDNGFYALLIPDGLQMKLQFPARENTKRAVAKMDKTGLKIEHKSLEQEKAKAKP